MITIYGANSDDFASLGLGALAPSECRIHEEAGGMYELEIRHPIDDALKHSLLKLYRIIKSPAPVRESPFVSTLGTEIATITRDIYVAAKKTYIRATASAKGKRLQTIKKRDNVIVVDKSDAAWYRCTNASGGNLGYIDANTLEYLRTETEQQSVDYDVPSALVNRQLTQEQLFRIVSMTPDTKENSTRVIAQHISYDLKGAFVTVNYEPSGVAANEAVAFILDHLDHDIAPFNVYCYVSSTIKGSYKGKNLIECLLSPDDGIATQTHARVVRDNFDIYILPDVERDLGVEIRYGKNLLSANMATDASNVVTRIQPVGKDIDGNDLYITTNGGYVDSPLIHDYPVIYARTIEYEVAETATITKDMVRAELERLAGLEFSQNGLDMPTVELNSDFVRQELADKYRDIANLYALHMYDTARVVANYAGINAYARMVAYIFDSLAKRYDETTLGNPQDTQASVYGYEIASGSISGSRLASNSISGDKLRNLSVTYAKIAAATIKNLSADAITALVGRFNEIVSDKLTTDELYAALAEIMALKVGNLTAGDITTDTLAAALASFVVLAAGNAEFDLATITNLLANALILQEGVAGSMQITNLAVTSANLLNATIGKLIIRGEDGGYYAISVGADGTIRTEPVTLTEGEISAGETDTGRQIVETTINAESINGSTIRSNEATINTILTTALTAGKITANEALISSATIPQLYTTAVEALGNTMTFKANGLIQFMAGAIDDMQKWITLDPVRGFVVRQPGYTDADGVEHPASIWETRTDDEGYSVVRADTAEVAGSFGRMPDGTGGIVTGSIRIGDVILKRSGHGSIIGKFV